MVAVIVVTTDDVLSYAYEASRTVVGMTVVKPTTAIEVFTVFSVIVTRFVEG